MSVDDGRFPSSIPAILGALKRLYRSKGMRYKEVADALGTSEVSVKRYMSGQGLTLQLLEKLCGLIDLTVLDLLDIVRQDTRSEDNALSFEQEEALAREPFLSVVLFLLLRGWSVADLQEEFELQEYQINRYLTRLDGLGLISLFPMNKIKFRVQKYPRVKLGGPLMSVFDKAMKKDFLEFTASDPDLTWSFNYYKMSPGTLDYLRRHWGKLMQTVGDLADTDKNLPKDAAEWQGVLFLVRPVDLKKGTVG